ncbi:hypothetical protein BLFGPEAP_00169 [Candidatus Methanoperedenaceae archaeon GB50]|nr:hypothetical protein BLFGPEAP_00169 [Candidatus Methanoperedenaceae archaeon GB50]
MKKGLNISIPGWGQLDIKYLILDLNGTLALDGKLLPGVKKRLKHLSTIFERIFILTADTLWHSSTSFSKFACANS